jgi:hypothetical protein
MLARAHDVETTDTARGAGKGTQATHSVAAAERLDIEEGEDLLALEKLQGGNITCIAIGILAGTCGGRDRDRDRGRQARLHGFRGCIGRRPTLDDLAEDTSSRRHDEYVWLRTWSKHKME